MSHHLIWFSTGCPNWHPEDLQSLSKLLLCIGGFSEANHRLERRANYNSMWINLLGWKLIFDIADERKW